MEPLINCLKTFLIVSFVYLVAHNFTYHQTLALQNLFLSSPMNSASLIYFPHGVRVIFGVILGYRSILYLLPVIVWTRFTEIGFAALSVGDLLVVLCVLIMTPVTHSLLKYHSSQLRTDQKRIFPTLFICGLASAVSNMCASSIKFGGITTASWGFLAGDIFGLIACSYLFVLVLQLCRKVSGS